MTVRPFEEAPKAYVTWPQVTQGVQLLGKKIRQARFAPRVDTIVTFPRGGMAVAAMLAHDLDVKRVITHGELIYMLRHDSTALMQHNLLFVDDISDTGKTFHQAYRDIEINPDAVGDYWTASLYCRRDTTIHVPEFWVYDAFDKWIVFPWEI